VKNRKPNRRKRRSYMKYVATISVSCLAFLIFLSLAGFAADKKESASKEEKGQIDEPVPCQLCHEMEDCQWKHSKHSQSMGSSFLHEWKSKGSDQECLECHTKTYDVNTGHVSGNGVSCELCHGPDNPDHPKQTKTMMIPVTSEVCHDCHCVTWGQWKVSGHGQNGIQCFDCHKMHQVELLEEDPDKLCGTCHKERLSEFIKTTHGTEGLQCVKCHMPKPLGIDTDYHGKNVAGHTFTVNAWPCSGCHHDMVHKKTEHQKLQ